MRQRSVEFVNVAPHKAEALVTVMLVVLLLIAPLRVVAPSVL
jgi:hypothetical protein